MDTPLLIPALATAFHPDGSLDIDSNRALFREAATWDLPAYFIAGTTGEFVGLTTEEHLVLVSLALDVIGAERVIAHVGAATTWQARSLAVEARKLGVRRFSAVTPYYSAVTAENVRDYYAELRTAVGDSELYAYLFPARTGVELTPTQCADIVAEVGLDGVKVSIPGVKFVAELRTLVSPGVTILSGNDGLLPEVIGVGGNGIVSGAMQANPQPFIDQVKAISQDDRAAQARSVTEIAEVVALFGPQMDLTKEALRARGIFAATAIRIPFTAAATLVETAVAH